MRITRRLALAASAGLLSLAAAHAQAPAGTGGMIGFSAEGAARERALEARFDAALNPADLRGYVERMSSAPNQVGSPHDRANAEFMLGLFKSWGWDAHIETFQVLYPTPVTESVDLLGPTPFSLTLTEKAVPGDRTSTQTEGVLPAYLAFQGDGDVTAELVYVGYGLPEDYEALARAGVDVRGKIVLSRYGQGWRGLKPKLAQEHGAVGCLIYSDPAEDGYGHSDPYPKGGSRPADGIQRGSVEDITLYSGDPLTPGVGATADAKRLDRSQARAILKIPALPISYGDAQHLLAALDGPLAPGRFKGGLPLTYHLGPGPARVHLVVQSDWRLRPIYDVVGMMKGAEQPDRWVIRGNHHDGWVFGAWDPLSGNAALLAEAKAIGDLAKTGWKPKRTLVYVSWDAEEPGLMGSTEWAETHERELAAKTVVYVNSDENARGLFGAGGDPALTHLVNQVAAEVRDPETGVSIGARAGAYAQVAALNPRAEPDVKEAAKAAAAGQDMPLQGLGSGSDFTPFLQHVGVPTLNLEFGGEADQGGVYHSKYDSFDHYVRFGDPQFAYGVALAKTAGRVMLRAAQADAAPVRFTDFADRVDAYVGELRVLSDEQRRADETHDRLLDAGAFSLAADPTTGERPPERRAISPRLDLAALDQAAARLRSAAVAYDAAFARAMSGAPDARRMAASDAALAQLTQTIMSQDGLPGRPWYRNLVYAPGVLTGYGVKTLPGVREAIEARRFAEAQTFVGVTARALTAYAAQLDRATAALPQS